MGALSAGARATSRQIDRTDVLDANDCSVLAEIAKVLWPDATAANIAAEAHCTVRAAELYLEGKRKWSGDALAVIVAEILKRHGMRNVRVRAR